VREWFDRLYEPARYYQLAADDIRQSITRQVEEARHERDRGVRSPDDPWVILDLVDVVGIRDVGIFVFFRLPRTGKRINVYVADVLSLADIARGREAIETGSDASGILGEGYDVFDNDFVFSFPAFAGRVDDARLPELVGGRFFPR
jgi:hypothetical protein